MGKRGVGDGSEVKKKGYLQSRKKVQSAGYVRKIIQSCRRVVDFVAASDLEVYKLTNMEKRETEGMLLCMTSEYAFFLVELCQYLYLSVLKAIYLIEQSPFSPQCANGKWSDKKPGSGTGKSSGSLPSLSLAKSSSLPT